MNLEGANLHQENGITPTHFEQNRALCYTLIDKGNCNILLMDLLVLTRLIFNARYGVYISKIISTNVIISRMLTEPSSFISACS